MRTVDKIYTWLESDRSAQASRIFAAALAEARPPYANRIITVLLRRKDEHAWAGLIANYDRLDTTQRRTLEASPTLRDAALGVALRGNSAARQSALELLTHHRPRGLFQDIADALCDPSPRVREAAAGALRGGAQTVCDREYDDPAEYEHARESLVAALREALRTYERHLRTEVLEAALWFARDLEDNLWTALESRRGRVGQVVSNNLPAWDHPRMAGFLLLALGRPAWRPAAVKLLQDWSGRPAAIALLRHTDLLDQPEIAGQIRLLGRPKWLSISGPGLTELPAAALACLPVWVCYVGMPETERVRYLRAWTESALSELRRSAVYALARLASPAALEILADVAASPGPLSNFARWYVAGDVATAMRGEAVPAANPAPIRTIREGDLISREETL